MYKTNSEKTLVSSLGNEGVAYNIEDNKYYSLNETLFLIYKGVETEKSEEQIIQDLISEFEISEEACRSEVKRGLGDLLDRKIIQRV